MSDEKEPKDRPEESKRIEESKEVHLSFPNDAAIKGHYSSDPEPTPDPIELHKKSDVGDLKKIQNNE